ncbi:uncharacterized membrane protein YkvA (DUF1232 family) [Neobacillus sp. B4I6]|uniref:YkvA family protein n=1 Tax=Neobacillus sp. B4I6 TaxID=3373925 RepID=UPI003D257E46
MVFLIWWNTKDGLLKKEVDRLLSKKKIFEKEQQKYNVKAKDFLGDQQKTQGLLNKAIQMANEKKQNLEEVWEKLQLFFDLVKSYSKGEYKNVSPSTILTVVGTLLYFVSPLDLVPDFIIGLGILDDAALIGFTVKKISSELDAFNKWKRANIFAQENPLD